MVSRAFDYLHRPPAEPRDSRFEDHCARPTIIAELVCRGAWFILGTEYVPRLARSHQARFIKSVVPSLKDRNSVSTSPRWWCWWRSRSRWSWSWGWLTGPGECPAEMSLLNFSSWRSHANHFPFQLSLPCLMSFPFLVRAFSFVQPLFSFAFNSGLKKQRGALLALETLRVRVNVRKSIRENQWRSVNIVNQEGFGIDFFCWVVEKRTVHEAFT